MKNNKILLGTVAFVVVLAVIGILAVSFTMTPVLATNNTTAWEYINISCTTAIQVPDNSINAGTGYVTQECIDLFTNKSIGVVHTKNESNSCWSGGTVFDYIKIVNKGNNWLTISVNLTDDDGFIGQEGGEQFGYVNNTVYVQIENGVKYNTSESNDQRPACVNVSAYNETELIEGTPVVICNALAPEVDRNEIFLFKKWVITPKTLPGEYNFTETILATQYQCGGEDPDWGPSENYGFTMLVGTGDAGYGSRFSPIFNINLPAPNGGLGDQKLLSADALPDAGLVSRDPNLPTGIRYVSIDADFGAGGADDVVQTIYPNGTAATAIPVSNFPAGITGPSSQFAISADGSRLYFADTSTKDVAECILGAGPAYDCSNDTAFDLDDELSGNFAYLEGIVNIYNFDPTVDSDTIFFAVMGTDESNRYLAVVSWDGTTPALVGSELDISSEIPYIPTTNVRDIAYDAEYNKLYFLDSTTGIVGALQLGRWGNEILSATRINDFTEMPTNTIGTGAGGIAATQMGGVPGMIYKNP